MASRTATRYRWRNPCVIKDRRRPGARRAMAGVALSTGADMSCRFGLCILGNKNPAVTRRALASHACMIHRGGRPVYETANMAGITLRCGRNVRVGFRLRIGEIVGTAMAG